ncbi:MAG: alpha/beta hydrolase [Candidatus Hydrogenedentes bacterium]|nr:alpha/beta hydrolase [Candidatus Hydrogenedentota bacterium]
MLSSPPLSPRAVTVIGHGGIRLNVWDYGGDGPALVFSHCTGTLGRVWDPTISALGPGFRVLAIDTRAHGDSEAPVSREEYAWSISGHDLLAVIDHFGLDAPINAVGHSGGAGHVAYAEMHRPGSIGRVVLIDGIVGPSHAFPAENPLAAKVRKRINTFASLDEARERFAAKPPMNKWVPGALEAYLTHAFRAENGGITLKLPGDREAWFYELGGSHDAFEAMPGFTWQPLLVSGSDSYVLPLVNFQAQVLGGAPERVVEGAGHFIPQEKPEETAALLREWFGGGGSGVR